LMANTEELYEKRQETMREMVDALVAWVSSDEGTEISEWEVWNDKFKELGVHDEEYSPRLHFGYRDALILMATRLPLKDKEIEDLKQSARKAIADLEVTL